MENCDFADDVLDSSTALASFDTIDSLLSQYQALRRRYTVERADFLAWSAANLGRTFDRVVMNPPFDQGRWRAHLEAAAGMLAPGGRLVAVLPISAKSGVSLPGCAVSCGEVFERAFAGASVDVVILLADKIAS